MSRMSDSERKAFFQAVDEASQQATWCAVATVAKGDKRALAELLAETGVRKKSRG